MQAIYIQVKDQYLNNVLELLNSVKDVMIDQVELQPDRVDADQVAKSNSEHQAWLLAQQSSMNKTWSNSQDEVWDAL